MRIIAGKWKGKTIKVPCDGTRPSTDRTRQAIFSLLQNVTEGAVVLDLFAGSGALALESLSRGASEAVAVESDRSACHVIQSNANSLGCGQLKILQRSVIEFLRKGTPQVKFSLVFADPPYENEFQGSLLQQTIEHPNLTKHLSADALFIAESPKTLSPAELDTLPDYWNVVAQRNYGKSHLTILRHTLE